MTDTITRPMPRSATGTAPIGGVFSAATTPVGADGAPRLDLFAAHCRALIAEGCHGVALLGTTGEANSFSLAERHALLDAALAAGLRPSPWSKSMPGVVTSQTAGTCDTSKSCLSAKTFSESNS